MLQTESHSGLPIDSRFNVRATGRTVFQSAVLQAAVF